MLSAGAIHGAVHQQPMVFQVVTVLSELAERLDAHAIVVIAPFVRLPDVQRLGSLLDTIGQAELTTPLAGWLAACTTVTAARRPDQEAEGALQPGGIGLPGWDEDGVLRP